MRRALDVVDSLSIIPDNYAFVPLCYLLGEISVQVTRDLPFHQPLAADNKKEQYVFGKRICIILEPPSEAIQITRGLGNSRNSRQRPSLLHNQQALPVPRQILPLVPHEIFR